MLIFILLELIQFGEIVIKEVYSIIVHHIANNLYITFQHDTYILLARMFFRFLEA